VGALCQGECLPLLFKLHEKFGQLILRKIIKIIATRFKILRLKCIRFRGRVRTWEGRGGKGNEKEEGREREERGYSPQTSIPGAATA